MGSLFTSIAPALILDGVGEAIAARHDVPKVRAAHALPRMAALRGVYALACLGACIERGACCARSRAARRLLQQCARCFAGRRLHTRVLVRVLSIPHTFAHTHTAHRMLCTHDPRPPQVLLLNGSHDRETATCGGHGGPMRASDVVAAVTDALNRRRSRQGQPLRHPPAAYVSAILVPAGGQVEIDTDALALLGVPCVVEVPSVTDAEGRALFDADELVLAIGQLLHTQGLLPCGPAG